MTTVIIKEDGRFSIENSGFSRKGRLRISDGKAAIGRVGKMTLHEGDEVRILVLHGRSGRGQYTLVR